MKKLKISFLIVLVFACLFALADAVKEASSSVGNGDAMKHNMNEPNAVNPAKDNCQDYERDGIVKTEHPEMNLSNDYNSASYQEKK